MGCSASKLDDEETVQLCKDRKNFIKQAVEQRYRFALGQTNYIQSMMRISVALLNFVEGEEHHDLLASCKTFPLISAPVMRLSTEVVGTSRVVNCLRSRGNPLVQIEEYWPESPETMRVESHYSSSNHHHGIDGFFTSDASESNTSIFSSSPYNRPSYSSSSSQINPQWDFFWNPFLSLDQSGNNIDDEMTRLNQLREEEGIPDLEEVKEGGEEEEEEETKDKEKFRKDERIEADSIPIGEKHSDEIKGGIEKVHELKECRSQEVESVEVAEAQDAAQLAATARNCETEETPHFTIYVNRRPTSMVEVMKDLEGQFERICDSACQVSLLLEANRAQHSSASVKMLNPIALFRSTSSRSSSSRFLQASSSSRDDTGEGTSSDPASEECCVIFGSHMQSTLDRLYAWEKKLYDEVKSGERIRIAYDRKCMQLRNHDVNGAEPFVVDKTRAAIRDLHTCLKVSIHSVESVSMRIEALRDQELYPQLIQFIKGLAAMWKIMAECHGIQKHTIDEAKVILFSSTSTSTTSPTPENYSGPEPNSRPGPSKPAYKLVAELRNWRACLAAWVQAQRAYARALAGWATRCTQPQHHTDGQMGRSPFNPNGINSSASPVFEICVRWSRLIESAGEARVIDGINFLAAGIESLISAQQREGAATVEGGVVVATTERTTEVGAKVLCAGLSKVVGSLTEFADGFAEGYEELVKKLCEESRFGD